MDPGRVTTVTGPTGPGPPGKIEEKNRTSRTQRASLPDTPLPRWRPEPGARAFLARSKAEQPVIALRARASVIAGYDRLGLQPKRLRLRRTACPSGSARPRLVVYVC